MAEYDPTSFEGTYNHPSTGSFKTTGLRAILAATMRQFTTDIKDSFQSNLKVITPSTAGGTITLDFSNRQQAVFVGSASFATAKAVALSNDSVAVLFELLVNITNVAGTLDFGSGSVFVTNSSDFNTGTQVYTPSFTGVIKIRGTKAGSNWYLEFSGPYA